MWACWSAVKHHCGCKLNQEALYDIENFYNFFLNLFLYSLIFYW